MKLNIRQVKSWSLSALHLYEQCPYKYAIEKFSDLPRGEPSFALQKGIAIHSKMEHYLNGNIQGIPPELKKLAPELKNLKSHDPKVEEVVVLNSFWEPLEEDNPWRSKNAWLRMKIDSRVNSLVVDLKTGKAYDKYAEQGELYSIGVMKSHPEYDEIDVEFWYSNTGEIQSYAFFRSDIDDMIEVWEERVKKLFVEEHWLPIENEFCKWCEFQKICPLYS